MAKIITTIKTIATLGKRELRYTEMDGIKKFDIRAWKGDRYDDGVRFTQEEINQLYFRMKSNLDTALIGNKTLVFENDEYALSIVSNGRTYVRPFATKDEMDKLMQILEVAKDNLLEYDPTPKVEEPKKKRGRPKKNNLEMEVKKQAIEKRLAEDTPAPKKEEKKSNILQFPMPKPEIEKNITEGNATYEECEEKANREKAIFVDCDSQYVLDGLLELCKVDGDFRNNFMREDKNFEGVMEYMSKMCQQGYGYRKGNYGFMDRDMGLGFAIDYYNLKPEEKKVVEKKRGRKKAQ